MTRIRRVHFAIALKLIATVTLFWFVLSRVDIGEMVSRLSAARIAAALLAGGGVMLLQSVIAAMRLQICAGVLGRKVARFDAWTACQLGGLFSHTPASFVGGDAIRIWHLVRSAVPLTDAAKTVLLDRALGFIGMMVLVLATSPGLQGAIQDPGMWTGYLLLIAAGLAAALAFIVLGRVRLAPNPRRTLAWIAEFVTVSRYLSASPRQTAKAIAIAIVMSAMNGLAIWVISLAYGTGINLMTVMIASAVVFLIAMIPISVAGWGLREGAFVVAFALFGVSSADALTLSVTFGIAVLLAYLPAVVLLLARRRIARAPKEAGYAQASSQPTAHS